VFLATLEQVRRRYAFDVIGFVTMPEHVDLLISEAERANPSVVIQVLKQGVAGRLLAPTTRERKQKPF
jgi:REP element-mobilizing transposase RayT